MNHSHQQKGFVLVTALIFLIVLSSLGVMALRGSLFEERMSANDRDRALAREYAEMALRDAERDVLGLRFDGQLCALVACNPLRPDGTRPKTTSEAANFWNTDTATNPEVAFADGGRGQTTPFQGVFTYNASTECGQPVWTGADWLDNAAPARACAGTIAAAVPTVAYGQFTEAPFVGPDGNAPQGVTPPRYLIEVFPAPSLLQSKSQKVFFRITAVGFGRTSGPNGRTSVTLQSIFSPA
ncbi:pilus assembly PilX family protein [Hydrogenophaga sp. A37]|uniref:pilus assembly PilX family protein n=1 Tax=Hydrogenophaga sp. A37 TaxID=1945864 RepID=UPI0009868227|nr:PilX N-terminal domain-containing pilus assembly protein [Hydrogenophaga sp. A37]OOG79430.1 hypothetical protein B0E41_23920 [Hydrogenophaga sp. A37]